MCGRHERSFRGTPRSSKSACGHARCRPTWATNYVCSWHRSQRPGWKFQGASIRSRASLAAATLTRRRLRASPRFASITRRCSSVNTTRGGGGGTGSGAGGTAGRTAKYASSSSACGGPGGPAQIPHPVHKKGRQREPAGEISQIRCQDGDDNAD